MSSPNQAAFLNHFAEVVREFVVRTSLPKSRLRPGEFFLAGQKDFEAKPIHYRRIDACRHADQMVGSQRTIGGVRPDHGHIGHALAEREAAHAIPELIDFPDDVIAHYERRPKQHRLRVQMSPDRDVGVLEGRGEHSDTHFAPTGYRQGSVDYLQLIGTAEAPDLNNPVARLGP
jgi:hypothetical protein